MSPHCTPPIALKYECNHYINNDHDDDDDDDDDINNKYTTDSTEIGLQ